MKILLSIIGGAFFFQPSLFGIVKVGITTVNNTNEHYLLYVRYMKVPEAFQSGTAWDAGNNISGKTAGEIADIVTAIKLLEKDDVCIEIFDKMKASTETFAFSNAIHAKEVVRQRLETIAMMFHFNDDARYTYWGWKTEPSGTETFHEPSTTAGGWVPGSKTPYYFRLKTGLSYAGINNLCAPPPNKTFGECGGAIIACVWWGASRGMGEARFNSQYSAASRLNMDEGQSGSSKWNLKIAEDYIPIPGDMVYFENSNYKDAVNEVSGFNKRGLLGDNLNFWAGENALYLGRTKYGGLGANAWNLTVDEMRTEMMNAYNRDLKKVIAEAKKHDGHILNGLKMEDITETTKASLIPIKWLKRVRF